MPGAGHSNEHHCSYPTLLADDLVDWTVLQPLLAVLQLAAALGFWVGWLHPHRLLPCSCFHCMLVTALRLLVVCSTCCLVRIATACVVDRAHPVDQFLHNAGICSRVSRRSPSGSDCKACPAPLPCCLGQIAQGFCQRQKRAGPSWRSVISWGCNPLIQLDFAQVYRLQGCSHISYSLKPVGSFLSLEPGLTGGITCYYAYFLSGRALRPQVCLEDLLCHLLTY